MSFESYEPHEKTEFWKEQDDVWSKEYVPVRNKNQDIATQEWSDRLDAKEMAEELLDHETPHKASVDEFNRIVSRFPSFGTSKWTLEGTPEHIMESLQEQLLGYTFIKVETGDIIACNIFAVQDMIGRAPAPLTVHSHKDLFGNRWTKELRSKWLSKDYVNKIWGFSLDVFMKELVDFWNNPRLMKTKKGTDILVKWPIILDEFTAHLWTDEEKFAQLMYIIWKRNSYPQLADQWWDRYGSSGSKKIMEDQKFKRRIDTYWTPEKLLNKVFWQSSFFNEASAKRKFGRWYKRRNVKPESTKDRLEKTGWNFENAIYTIKMENWVLYPPTWDHYNINSMEMLPESELFKIRFSNKDFYIKRSEWRAKWEELMTLYKWMWRQNIWTEAINEEVYQEEKRLMSDLE